MTVLLYHSFELISVQLLVIRLLFILGCPLAQDRLLASRFSNATEIGTVAHTQVAGSFAKVKLSHHDVFREVRVYILRFPDDLSGKKSFVSRLME